MNVRIPVAAALVLVLGACTGDSTGPSGSSGSSIATLTVSPNPVSVAVGDSVRLTASATTTSGAAATVSFASLDPSIATVTSTGTVHGVSVGTARVVASAGDRADTVTVNVTATGFTTFNVNTGSDCASPTYAQFRTAATGQHVILMEDTRNPPGGFTAAEYQAIASRFDNLVWPTDTNAFGTPSDIDNNGKVIVLFTRAVNELTPANVNYIIGGFFFARDLLPRTANATFGACPGSNVGEMFYMLAPDSTGTINGNSRTKSFVSSSTVGTLAHEFQHLINASRRFYVNNAPRLEAVWLDEGLAHIAEELNFYADAGLGPRQNLGQAQILSSQSVVSSFNEFAINNFGRFEEYLKAPPRNAPYAANDSLATRGATWSLLRYSADRKGAGDQPFFHALVNSTDTGVVNLSNVVGGASALADYVRDWTVANYADDAGFATEARFQQPSWNFRDIFANAAFGGYPLAVTKLSSGVPATTSIKAGSAAYDRFGVAAGATADVRVSAGGTTVANACTPVSLTVGQVYQAAATATPALCVPGGASGAEYALILTYDVLTPEQTASVTATATGIVAVTGPPNPDRLPTYSLAPDFRTWGAWRVDDGGFELRLRERERTELARYILRSQTPSRAVLRDVAATGVVINLVRTK